MDYLFDFKSIFNGIITNLISPVILFIGMTIWNKVINKQNSELKDLKKIPFIDAGNEIVVFVFCGTFSIAYRILGYFYQTHLLFYTILSIVYTLIAVLAFISLFKKFYKLKERITNQASDSASDNFTQS